MSSDEEETPSVTSPSPASPSTRPSKKRKAAVTHKGDNNSDSNSSQSAYVSIPKPNADGEYIFNIGRHRRLTVRQWKKQTQIDVREFYEDKTSGELRPGKKGIALTVEQFRELENQMEAVKKCIEQIEK